MLPSFNIVILAGPLQAGPISSIGIKIQKSFKKLIQSIDRILVYCGAPLVQRASSKQVEEIDGAAELLPDPGAI